MSITVFKPNGEAFDYRKVSERLPDFLQTFPLTEGYRVVRSHRFMIEDCPGLVRLYEAAISQGKSIYEMGLPEITTSVVFEAALYRNDDLIANASASKVVVGYKDWECGETAAFQRLMAACGFGGEVLDLDSDADFEAQQLRVVVSDSDTGAKKGEKKPRASKKAEKPAKEAVVTDEKETAVMPEPDQASETKEEPEPAPTQQPVEEEEEVAAGPVEPIQSQLMTVLNQLARGKGLAVPQVRNNQEARAAIQELKRAG